MSMLTWLHTSLSLIATIKSRFLKDVTSAQAQLKLLVGTLPSQHSFVLACGIAPLVVECP
jgi:hypothetical protein